MLRTAGLDRYGEELVSDNGLPYQMDVYYDGFPEIDCARLAAFVNQCDPGEDPCMVERMNPDEMQQAAALPGGQVRLEGYTATLGDFSMMMLAHGVPSPAAGIIPGSRLRDLDKKRLLEHRSFVLLSNFGGQQYKPYENQIFLIKVAMGLCEQGALGAGFPHIGLVFPGGFLLELAKPVTDPESEGAVSVWKSIREEGEPWQLFADMAVIELDGKRYLCTHGFCFCGFSDFAARVTSTAQAQQMSTVFENLFSYLMTNGPVIQAGHTMGADENDVALRFSKPPASMQFPFPTYDRMLIMTREKKRKKILGIF